MFAVSLTACQPGDESPSPAPVAEPQTSVESADLVLRNGFVYTVCGGSEDEPLADGKKGSEWYTAGGPVLAIPPCLSALCQVVVV